MELFGVFLKLIAGYLLFGSVVSLFHSFFQPENPEVDERIKERWNLESDFGLWCLNFVFGTMLWPILIIEMVLDIIITIKGGE